MNHFKESKVSRVDKNQLFYVRLQINKRQVTFYVDPGSPWSLMSEHNFETTSSVRKPYGSDVRLKTFTKRPGPVIGEEG